MRVADQDGKPRSEFVNSTFGPDSPVLKALSSRYALRFFRFSSSADRVAAARDLTYNGTQTKLGEALLRAKEEFSGLPLAGLVMVTDGADTQESSIQESLLGLRAAQVPVFTVGVGRESFGKDIQVSRVNTPRTVLKGTNLSVDVIIVANGYSGTTVPLNVEDAGRILSTQDVTLSQRRRADDRARALHRERTGRAHDPVPDSGAGRRRNHAEQRPGGAARRQDRKEKILFFDGEPHFEVKFIRRAVDDDKNLQLVLLERTAENKYMRIMVDSPDELAAGFPKTRDELFAYRGLILGSIEASAFTGDQLRMIADFADRRGGGLLMIGGKRAFAEGGYAGTPVADALPVVLDSKAPESLSRLHVTPTRAGEGHAVTQIGRPKRTR